jgi:hypothetical protein
VMAGSCGSRLACWWTDRGQRRQDRNDSHRGRYEPETDQNGQAGALMTKPSRSEADSWETQSA